MLAKQSTLSPELAGPIALLFALSTGMQRVLANAPALRGARPNAPA